MSAGRERRLLFVCTGNVCRSLLAERLCRELARRRGLAVEARSCGVAAENWYAVPAEIWRALEESGAPREPHRPQLVGRPLLEWADEVLAMTERQRAHLRDAFPEHGRKLFLLRERAGLSGDVADPIGRPWAEYDACRRAIAEALERLLPGKEP